MSPVAQTLPVVAAIPARYRSERLPGKALRSLAGRPLIQHVWERAVRAPGIGRVVVLTDDERIADAVRGFGGEVELTPSDCRSGTDRIAWAAREWTEDGVVNVQGDEPLVEPEAIALLARHLATTEDPMVTLATGTDDEDGDDPNVVKVVVDQRGYALYFSRSRIPHPRVTGAAALSRHLGLYGYRRRTLLELAALPPTPLERSESLEQLRALENGIPIRVLSTSSAYPGVDTEEDLERVAAILGAEEEER